LDRRLEYASEWLEVVTKEVDLGPPRGRERFFAVSTTYDYAAVLAVTEDGRVPLVRQFRPAVEEDVLELPSGAVDDGERPEDAMRRELLEETGCEAGELVTLGSFFTDSGRLETRQWGFFAPNVRVVADGPADLDEPLELRFVRLGDLRGIVARGELRVCPHLAILASAVFQGHVEL
jgi:ADP-ribose pyrophosphatase